MLDRLLASQLDRKSHTFYETTKLTFVHLWSQINPQHISLKCVLILSSTDDKVFQMVLSFWTSDHSFFYELSVVSPKFSTWPAHPTPPFDFTTLIKFGKEQAYLAKLLIIQHCYPLTYSPLSTSLVLNTLSPDIINRPYIYRETCLKRNLGITETCLQRKMFTVQKIWSLFGPNFKAPG